MKTPPKKSQTDDNLQKRPYIIFKKPSFIIDVIQSLKPWTYKIGEASI